MSSATNSSGCISGRSSAIASSPSSATVEIVTVLEGVRTGVLPISVDHHDAALFYQHPVGAHLRHHSLDLALHLSLYRNHHTFYSHTHLIDHDAALAHLEFDGLHGLRLDFTRIDLGCLVALTQLGALVARLDQGGLVPLTQRDALVAFRDFDFLVTVLHRLSLVVLDLGDAIVAHLPRFVVLHQGREVLFRLETDQFAAHFVFEGQHVEIVGPALRAAPRLDPADRFIIGQRPGRHQVGVVHAAHHDRLIDIAFQEIHDHFLANPRDVDRTPLLASPKRGDAHPAPPCGLLRDLTPLIVLLSGSVQGGIRSALYTLPTTIG